MNKNINRGYAITANKKVIWLEHAQRTITEEQQGKQEKEVRIEANLEQVVEIEAEAEAIIKVETILEETQANSERTV